MIIDNDYSFMGSDIRKIREAKGYYSQGNSWEYVCFWRDY